MHYESPFACVTTDSGLVAEILHVSPIFIRCGPPSRGVFDDRRLARTRRTDARREQRPPAAGHDVIDFARSTTVS